MRISLSKSITSIEFPRANSRIQESLALGGIRTVLDLVQVNAALLEKLPKIGRSRINVIRDALETYELELGMTTKEIKDYQASTFSELSTSDSQSQESLRIELVKVVASNPAIISEANFRSKPIAEVIVAVADEIIEKLNSKSSQQCQQ